MINSDSLSLEQLENLESLCRQFEEAKSPNERKIEQLIEGTAAPYRAYFLRELLWLDLETREKQNLKISADDYTFDDPLDREVVRAVFEERQNEGHDKTKADWPERYQAGRTVGKGGIGEIRAVVDRQSQRPLAMKTLRSTFRGNAFANDRLHREAILTGRLQHPGIPPVFDHGQLPDGSKFFTMKLIDGKNLSEMLGERTSADKSLPEFLRIYESVAQTMAYAHQNGVVHRDLKPANIMVGPFGEVQVMDWGMARDVARADLQTPSPSVTQDASVPSSSSLIETPAQYNLETHPDAGNSIVADAELTRAGDVLGTPAYMSPEQAHGRNDRVGPAADVFSLGAILLEILTGSPLHSGISVEESIERTKAGNFRESLDRLAQSHGDAKLKSLCHECLTFDSDQRPASAEWVAKEMRRYLEDAEQQRQAAELLAHAADVRSEEESRRRKMTAWLSSVIGLVFLVGLVGVTWQWNLARANAEIAEQRFLEAKQMVDEYFADVAESPELKKTDGTHALRRRLLEKARKYYAAFAASKPDSVSTQEELAAAYMSLGSISQELDPGIGPIEHFEKSRELSQQLIEQGHGRERTQRLVLRSCLNSAIVFHKVERFEDSVRSAQNGLKAIESLADQPERFTRIKLDLLFQQARAQQELGKDELVDKLTAEIEAYLTGPLGKTLNTEQRNLHLCQIRQTQAKAFLKKEDYKAAENAYRESLDLGRRLGWDGFRLSFLGNGLANAVRTSEASIDVHLDFLPALEEYCHQNPLLIAAHAQLAAARTDLCFHYARVNRGKESVVTFRVMLKDLKIILERHPDSIPLQQALVSAYKVIYSIRRTEIPYEEIVEHFQDCHRTLRHLTRLIPERKTEHLIDRCTLHKMTGIISRAYNRIDEAVEAYRQGMALIDENQPTLNQFRPEFYNNLGYLYLTQGQSKAAVAELEVAAAGYRDLADEAEPYNQYFGYEASTQTNIAAALLELGQVQEAMERLNSAVKTLVEMQKNRPRRSQFFGYLVATRLYIVEANLMLNRPANAAAELERIESEAIQNKDANRHDVSIALVDSGALKFQTRIATEDCESVLADLESYLETAPSGTIGSDTHVLVAETYATAANKAPKKQKEYLSRCAELLNLALDHPERFGRMGPKRILTRAPLKAALESPQLAEVVKRVQSI